MTYKTQSVAHPYFIVALLLFVLQVLVGLWLAINYSVTVPQGVDDAQVRKHMAEVFGVEIAGAFGLDIVRVGQMGEQCRPHNLLKTLYAMGRSFQHVGADLDVRAGMTVLEDHLQRYHAIPE